MFSKCSGECCVCMFDIGCVAGSGDDYFTPASKEQIIERLNKGKYPHYYDYMTSYLKIVFEFEYKEPKHKNFFCEQYSSIFPIKRKEIEHK